MRPALLGNFVDAAETFGGEKAGADTFAFEERVRAYGGAMTEIGDVGRRNTLFEEHLNAAEDGARRVVRGGGQLGDGHLARLFVQVDEVGEGPSGVDGQAVAAH